MSAYLSKTTGREVRHVVDRQLPGGECFSEYFKVSRLPKLHCGSSRQLHWWGGAGGALDSGEEKNLIS